MNNDDYPYKLADLDLLDALLAKHKRRQERRAAQLTELIKLTTLDVVATECCKATVEVPIL